MSRVNCGKLSVFFRAFTLGNGTWATVPSPSSGTSDSPGDPAAPNQEGCHWSQWQPGSQQWAAIGIHCLGISLTPQDRTFLQKNTTECFLVTKIVLVHTSRKEALGPWIEVEPKPTVTSDQHLVLICFRGIDVTVTGEHTCMSGVTFPALLVTSGTSVWVKHKGGDKHSSKPGGPPELTQRLWKSQALKAYVGYDPSPLFLELLPLLSSRRMIIQGVLFSFCQ